MITIDRVRRIEYTLEWWEGDEGYLLTTFVSIGSEYIHHQKWIKADASVSDEVYLAHVAMKNLIFTKLYGGA